MPLRELTLDQQVAGGADGSSLVGGGARKAPAVFCKGFADHQPSQSAGVADLEVNGALNLVVLPEPHDDGGGLTADLAFQGHRLALSHVRVLQALQEKTQHL